MLETVAPMCPPGYLSIFIKNSPKYGKRRAKRELETVPPRELETVPLLGVINGPLRWYRKLSGGTISNFRFACGTCENEIFEKGGTETNFPEGQKVVQ